MEARPYLGGRLSSHFSNDIPTPFDNGPHLFLSTYTSTRRLLRELGCSGALEFPWPGSIPFIRSDGMRGVLREWPLPSPGNLAAGLLNFPLLSWSARRRAVATVRELLSEPVLNSESAGQWLSSRWGDEERTIFWEPLIQAALNAGPEDIPVRYVQIVFREGFCKGLFGGRPGCAREPLGKIFAEDLRRAIELVGVEVMLKTPSSGAVIEGNQITAVRLKDGQQLSCDAVVAALPPWALADWLSSLQVGEVILSAYKLSAWQAQSISSLYLWAEPRPWLDSFTCLPGHRAAWLFDFARIWGNRQGPVCILLGNIMVEKETEASNRSLPQIIRETEKAFPQLRPVRWNAYKLVTERKATPLRPRELWGKILPQNTPIPNLFLAGDWLDPDLPPTVEAAVRAGERAAKSILQSK